MTPPFPQARSRGRSLRFLWVGLTLAAILTLPLGAYAQTTARDTLPVVNRVDVEGNVAFSDDQIRRAIATRATGCKSVFLAPLCWMGIEAFERTQRLDARELRTDVARVRIFYFRRGYRQAQVDTSLVRASGKVDVIFKITENSPVIVEQFEVLGLEGIPESAEIIAQLPLRVGEPFSEIDLADSHDVIASELGRRGYARAVVLVSHTIPSSDSLGARVVLQVERGPLMRISEIEVSGTVEFDPQDVKRLLNFRRNDIYDSDAIISSQRKLYSMALFQYVDITTRPSPSDSAIDVLVQVNEAAMRGVQLGFGLTTADCIHVQTAWTHRNFLHGARRLELSAQISNIGTSQLARQFPCRLAGVERGGELSQQAFNRVNWLLRADFQQPWFLGTDNLLRLGVFSERQSLPNIYAVTGVGADVSFRREIEVGSAVQLIYRPQLEQLESGSSALYFCANFGICQPDDVAEVAEPRWLSPVTMALSRIRTDAIFSPTHGHRLRLEMATASRFTGSEWAFYRALAELRGYRQLRSGSVVAFRLRGGLVRPIGSGIEGSPLETASDPVTPPQERFYAGGANTVRGYGQNLLGPKVLTAISSEVPGCDPANVTANNTWVCDPNLGGLTSAAADPLPIGGQNALIANLELRMPLTSDRWTAVTFLDFGRVWTGDDPLDTNSVFAWSPGIGIRYRSPVGPLRVDIGYYTGGAEQLPVVSALVIDGEETIVPLGDSSDNLILYDYDPIDESGFGGFLNRLQLHLSIGQAF